MRRNKRHSTRDGREAATWKGARREAMRRWAKPPQERILAAQEEMADLAEALGHDLQPPKAQQKVAEPKTGYGDSSRPKNDAVRRFCEPTTVKGADTCHRM